MDNSNIIHEIRNADGTVDYSVSLGSVLYNDRILDLSNLIIPIRGQTFFTLPEDKGKYAAINVYYRVEDGEFIFDLVKKSVAFVQSVTSDAISNCLPIAQFLIQESYGSFNVLVINQYSKMATFSITSSFEQGDRGLQGRVGATGLDGYVGSVGETGIEGLIGYTGPQGVTGVGSVGEIGPQGATGVYPSTDLLFYGKFKSDNLSLLDYAVYERDLEWGATGAGYTGVGYTGIGLGDTGLFFMPQEQSSFVVVDGIVDNSHSIVYRGGRSGYTNDKFLGFTGSIQAWVRLDVPPIADFSYTVDPSKPTRVTFTDTSVMYPTSWSWSLGGVITPAKNITYTFPTSGTYLVILTVTNAAGSSERAKSITL